MIAVVAFNNNNNAGVHAVDDLDSFDDDDDDSGKKKPIDPLKRLPQLLIPALSKIPLALPFVQRFITKEQCVAKIKDMAKASQKVEREQKAERPGEEYSKAQMTSIMCVLGDECADAFLKALKETIDSASFIKTMVEKQLPNGLTLEVIANVASVILRKLVPWKLIQLISLEKCWRAKMTRRTMLMLEKKRQQMMRKKKKKKLSKTMKKMKEMNYNFFTFLRFVTTYTF